MLTMEHIEHILDDVVDWDDVLLKYFTSDYNMQVVLHTDGRVRLMDPNEHYRDPEAAGVLYIWRTPGINNLDRTHFTEGYCTRADDGSPWVEYDEEEGVYRHRETGEEVDPDVYIDDEYGHIVGNFEDLIKQTIEWGNTHDDIESLKQEVINYYCEVKGVR